jgi:hypothetical protein
MIEEFLVSWKGETLGPFSRDEVESRLRSGEITPLHAIRRNGELIDAARWLHSLRPAKLPIVPSPPPEPIAPPPTFSASAFVEPPPAPSAVFANSSPPPVPFPPHPPAPTNYGSLYEEPYQLPKNPTGKATAGLVLGIIGLLAWIIPLFGFPITIVGLVLSSKGMKSSNRGMAIAGLVLNIIGILLCTISAIYGAILGYTGQHPFLQ